MRVLSCNVRRDNVAVDKDNQWRCRKDLCCDVIRSTGAQLICAQEVSRQQFRDLSAALPEYDWFGMVDTVTGRDPMNAIFYRRDSLERISAGGCWLSETPHVAGSKSWSSDCIRLANWARLLESASGVEFRVVNAHLDHVSQLARENQARLINEDAAVYPAGYPQILAGDMNCDRRNPVIPIFRKAGWRDTYEDCHGTTEPGATYHAFRGPEHEGELGRIDWIFVRGSVKTRGAAVVRDSRAARFPSDHYFILADLEFTGGAK